MKHNILKLLLLLLITGALRASALPASALALQTELDAQLALQTNSASPNRALVSALNRARNTWLKPGNSNIVTRLKSLSSVAAALNRTTLASEVAAEIEAVVDEDAMTLVAAGQQLQARLDAALPGRLATAAQNRLNNYFRQINQASSNANSVVAARLLSTAARQLNAVNAAITRAENAPVGGEFMTAQVNGGSFRANPRLVLQGLYTPATHSVNISGSQLQGRSTASIVINLFNVNPGTSTLPLGPGAAVYSSIGLSGQAIIPSSAGTITITLDTTRKVLSGTFSFTGANQTGSADVQNGAFLVKYE